MLPEHAPQQGAALLDSLIELSPLPVCLLARNGELRRWGPAFGTTLERDPQPLRNAEALSWVFPEDRPGVLRALARAEAGEAAAAFETRCPMDGGGALRIDWRARSVGEDGLVAIVAQSVTRVGEAPAPEGLPSDSTGYARLLAENVPALVAYYDTEQRLLYGNAAYESWTARPLTDMIGRPRTEILKPDEIERTTAIQDALRGETTRITERIAFGDGVTRDVLIVYAPHRDPQGEVAGVLVVATELTEPLRIQEELRRSEQRYRDLVEGSLQGMMVHRDGNVVLANPAFAAMLGFDDPAAMVGLPISEFWAPEEAGRMEDLRLARLRGENPPQVYTFQAMRRDGRRCWFQAVNRLVDWDGMPAVQAIFMDVTERLETEHRLRESQRLLRTFFDAVPQQMYVKDLENRFLTVNRRWGEFFRVDPDECLQFTTETLPRQESAFIDGSLEMDAQVLSTGEPQVRELVVTGPDGQKRIHRNHKAALRDEDGRIVGICGYAEDVTEQVEAERRLRDSQRLLRTLIDTSPQQMFVKRLDGGYVLANREWGECFGLDPLRCEDLRTEDLPNQSPDFLRAIQEMDAEVRRTGEMAVREVQVRDRHGRMRTHLNFKTVLRDDAGAVIGICGFAQDITERVQAERRLRENQRLLRAVFDTVPQQMYVKDLENRFLIVNRNWGDYYRIDPDDCGNWTTEQLPIENPEFFSITRELDRTVVESGEARVREQTLVRGGREVIQRIFKAPLRDEAGKIIGIIGFAEDVTPRVLVERALRENRRLLRTVLDTVPQQIFVKDLENRYLLVNRTFGDMAGIDPEDCGKYTTHTVPLHPPEFAAQTLEIDQEVLETGRPHVREQRLTMLDGSPLVQRTFKAPLRDEDGRVVGIVGFSEDITDRVQAQEALEESRQLLQSVVDTVPHAIFVKDTQGRFRLANKAFGEFHRRSPESIVGITTQELFAPDEAMVERLLAQDRRVWEGHRELIEPEVHMRDAAGNDVIHQVQKLPLRNAAGEPLGLVGLSEDVTAAVQAREALRRSEARNKAILQAIPDLMLVMSAEGEVLDYHAHDLTLLLSESDALVGRNVVDILPDPAASHILAAIREVSTTGEPKALEYPLEVLQGRRIFEARMVRHAEGQVLAMVRDVTAARTAESEARASQALLRAVFDAIPFPISLKGRDGRYVTVNRSLAEARHTTVDAITGHTLDELPGGRYEDVTPIRNADAHVLHSGETVELSRTTLRRDDGEPRQMRILKAPYRDADGEVAGIVTLGVDITDLLETERRLRESEERFRQTVENIPSAIFLKDLKGIYLLVNRQMETLVGRTRDELLGRTARELFPERADIYEDLDREVIASGNVVSREIDFTNQDGEPRIYLDTKFPMHDAEGMLSGLGVILTDITEQRRTEIQLRQAQKMEAIGQLAGGVAHDFNNILQIIAGYIGMMLRSPELADPLRGPLQEVDRAAGRAADLTRKLLAFSRQQTLRLGTVDVTALITDQMQMVRRVIGEQVQLRLCLEEGPMCVHGDAGALEQVLLNLCINARDAMPKGGEITISAGRVTADREFLATNPWASSGEYVCIAVTDTGEGMAEEVREHIFEPFYTTKEVGQGSGLGLAMVYGIVAEHGGHIEVESTPDAGSVFRLYLPVVERGADPAPEPAPEAPRSGSATLLVAEDEPSVLRLLTAMLEGEGYKVFGVEDGSDAVEFLAARRAPVDLLILDMIMPRMGGREAFEALRAQGIELPVVFSTGYDAHAIDSDLLKTPGVYLIQKPYNPTSLFQVVHEALKRS